MGGALGEAFEVLRKSVIKAMWVDELLSDCALYDKEDEIERQRNFPNKVVKVMKSQVLDRKLRCIRARTVC